MAATDAPNKSIRSRTPLPPSWVFICLTSLCRLYGFVPLIAITVNPCVVPHYSLCGPGYEHGPQAPRTMASSAGLAAAVVGDNESRSPRTQERGEVEGAHGAVAVEVGGAVARIGTGAPASQQVGQVGGVDVAVAVEVSRRAD